MGLTKSGDIIYRNKYSRCEICKNYIENYLCWYENYIPVWIWNESDYLPHVCDYFKSTISDQCNSHYVHPDYEDKERFPVKEYGKGKYRFNSKGERI